MWMGRQLSRRNRETPSDTGVVSAAGEKLCVVSDGELRRLSVYAPGGYRWAPAAGQDVLVLKNGAVISALQDDTPEPGSVELFAPGGTLIRLKPGGEIEVEGDVTLQGSLQVKGNVDVVGAVSCLSLTVAGVSVP